MNVDIYVEQHLLMPFILSGLQALKTEKECKQRKMKMKFQRMHKEKRRVIEDEIIEISNEISLFKQMVNINDVFVYVATAEQLKNRLNEFEKKVQDIEYEEKHFEITDSQSILINPMISDFDYYYKLWKFTSEWTFVKHLSNALTGIPPPPYFC